MDHQESNKGQMSAINEKLVAHHGKQETLITELRQKAERGQMRILSDLTYVTHQKHDGDS